MCLFQHAVYCPVKPSRVLSQSPQKVDVPTARSAFVSVTSPEKSSINGTAFPHSPQKAGPSSSTSLLQSPLKNQVPSKVHGLTASPQKPELRTKPAVVCLSITQEKSGAGAPGESCCSDICHYFGNLN